MTKKKSNEIDVKESDKNGKTNRQTKSKINLSGKVPVKQLRSIKLPSMEMKNNNTNLKMKDQSYHSEEQQQKSEYQLPLKTKKKLSKKKKGLSSKNNQKANKSGTKLQRGYKFCQNCQTVLNIHKYVCTKCGFVHNMKKHKFDVMKNLSKATPKIVKSIIESNEFNTINLSGRQIFTYDSSFDFRKLLVVKDEPQIDMKQKNQNNIKDEEMKRRKSQGKNDVTISIQSNVLNEKGTDNVNKIKFEGLKITKPSEFSSTVQIQLQKLKTCHNQFNKTREQFSIYKSPYPIICMQSMIIPANEKTNDDLNFNQALIFTQCVSKKQYFPQQNHTTDILSINRHQERNLQHEQIEDIMDQEDIEKGFLLKKQELRQKKLREEQEKRKELKLRENNTITQKALGLGNYHKISALYTGETIISVMALQRKNAVNIFQASLPKQSQSISQSLRRRSSSRSGRPGKVKFSMDLLMQKEEKKKGQVIDQVNEDDNVYDIVRIGLRQHVEMVKTIVNKVAILTGKKSVLLMNIGYDWGSDLMGSKIISSHLDDNVQNTTKKDSVIVWLSHTDFIDNNTDSLSESTTNPKLTRRYLSSISLSREGLYHNQIDQFTVIQWLKHHNLNNDNTTSNTQSYLITGTLFGHIIIYKVSNHNHCEIYRTIVGAHFQLVNCLSECPLNANGITLFASASYDGSVKIWELNRTQEVSAFEVSNRKIQSIHWDSGAKFLLIVRDEGLENCYLACFYSVNNRIQLPMMLTDTIDFRLIRNGLMFDNSCSPLITFPLNSKLIVMLNSRNGFLKILQTEELRKTSLKRKKSKKNYQQLLYHDYWIRFWSMQKSSQSPQVIEMKSNCTDFANYGFALKESQQIQNEQLLQEEKQENVIHDDDSEHNESKQKSQNLQEKAQIKRVNIIQNSPKLPQQSQPEPMGIRKSLRARKPNVQYNFMQEEQNDSQQQSAQNKKPKKNVKNKGKKKQSSDDDFQDQSQDFSQEVENDESEESFQNQKKTTQKNKQNRMKNHLTNKTKNAKKQKQRSQQQKPTQLRKNLRSRNDQKKQSKDQQGQEKLYKMFWQQTNEQSLVHKKEDYPCNRFPKFSGITSFLSVQGDTRSNSSYNQQLKSNQQQQKPISKLQYLTVFISTYNGELIRVRIKIDGYSNQIIQNKSIDQNQEDLSL